MSSINVRHICLLWSVSHRCWTAVSHNRASALKPGDDSIIVLRSPKSDGQCVKALYRPRRPRAEKGSSHLSMEPGCVRSLSSSSSVSLTAESRIQSIFESVIAGIGLMTCGLEFVQCVLSSRRSHTTSPSCRGLSRDLLLRLNIQCECEPECVSGPLCENTTTFKTAA